MSTSRGNARPAAPPSSPADSWAAGSAPAGSVAASSLPASAAAAAAAPQVVVVLRGRERLQLPMDGRHGGERQPQRGRAAAGRASAVRTSATEPCAQCFSRQHVSAWCPLHQCRACKAYGHAADVCPAAAPPPRDAGSP
jgi:hypothetical protein